MYFACVTVLTIGYGDLYPQTNLGRALLIPWSFGGILILGLVVFSIFKSVSDMGEKNIMRHHYEKAREKTLGRTVTTSIELERREIELELERERAHHHHHLFHHHHHHQHHHSSRGSARSPASMQNRKTTLDLLHKTSKTR